MPIQVLETSGPSGAVFCLLGQKKNRKEREKKPKKIPPAKVRWRDFQLLLRVLLAATARRMPAKARQNAAGKATSKNACSPCGRTSGCSTGGSTITGGCRSGTALQQPGSAPF